LICASGRQFLDWSADYRFFSRASWRPADVFAPVMRGVMDSLPDGAPLVMALDDTIIPKSGLRIPGVGYRRDPMSPPFHTNFIRGQRFLQGSACLPDASEPAMARTIPVRFEHVPPVTKPRSSASREELREYRRRCRAENMSVSGALMIRSVRSEMDGLANGTKRRLFVCADGSYCNSNVIKRLPDNSTLIARCRRDLHIHYPACQQLPRGRRRVYGDRAPTPEQLRTDDSVPWTKVRAFAAGSFHTFHVKHIGPVLWRAAGPDRRLQMVVIRPLRYRPSKNSRALYRRPSYFICTDPDLPLDKLLQYYIWRWDIEVNHRDEKQVIGVGQAQVRSEKSVSRVPAFAVAVYATLLLAASQVGEPAGLHPLPRWRWRRPPIRVTTQQLLRELRSEVWRNSIDSRALHFSHFASASSLDHNPQKRTLPLRHAALYVTH
jgi:hypothetical protein